MAIARSDPEDRWEFRAWSGENAANPFERTGSGWIFQDEAVRDDFYLLSSLPRGLLSKVRGGELFEAKRMLARDGALELWGVAVSEPFPLTSAGLALAGELAGVAPLSAGQGQSEAALLAALQAADPGLRYIEVRKRRRRYRQSLPGGTGVNAKGCRGEWTAVALPDSEMRAVTLSLEAVEAGKVREAARELGLDRLASADYGTWLRARLAER